MTDTKMTGGFSAKPKTAAFARQIVRQIDALGPTKKDLKAQASFAIKRKFLWLWTYGHTADGTLYMTVLLDHPVESDQFHYVKQVGPHRWNHHVVVKSHDQIKAPAVRDLLAAGYAFAGR